MHLNGVTFDGDSPLPLQGIGVHDQLADLLVGAEDLALFQQSVDQGGFAMVDVRDDGQIADVVVVVVVSSSAQINLPYPP